jgi:hypothetical protein
MRPESDAAIFYELGGAGFSLWVLVLASTNPHRLKPVPLVPGKRNAGRRLGILTCVVRLLHDSEPLI